jgi:HEAT repeat protein
MKRLMISRLRMEGRPALLAALLALSALVGGARQSLGAPKRKPALAAEPKLDLALVAADLSSRDAARLSAGLGVVRANPKEALPLAPLVERLLVRGLPIPLALPSLDALAALGLASSSAAVVPYMRHRAVVVRVAAAAAMARTAGPRALGSLRAALSDGSPEVRGAAAAGLARMGAREALGALAAALDGGVAEAGAAIGAICRGAECDALSERVASGPASASVPLASLRAGLTSVVLREGNTVPDEVKLRAVARLGASPSAEAGALLAELLRQLPEGAPPAVREALARAVEARAGGPAPPGARR